MRDEEWLQQRFDQIWSLFFPDVEKRDVSVRWKGRWKNKFGHISKSKKTQQTEIVINKLFRDVRVPEEIIKLTIAHEIVHYAHGFHSHLPKLFDHPHKGGVVNKELRKRGFGYALKFERQWIKNEWWPLHQELYSQVKKRKKMLIAEPPSTKQFSLWAFLKRQ